MITLPNTNKAEKQEQECIFSIAQHNGYSKQKITNMEQKERIKNKDTQTKTADTQKGQTQKKWVTFTYHSPVSKKDNQSIQQYRNPYRIQINKHNIPTVNRKNKKQKPKWNIRNQMQYM
jgi:hypothetical protein